MTGRRSIVPGHAGAAAAFAALLPASLAYAPRTATGAGEPRVPTVDRVVLVVFENKELPEVMGRGQAPTFDALARRYALLTDYHGADHRDLALTPGPSSTRIAFRRSSGGSADDRAMGRRSRGAAVHPTTLSAAAMATRAIDG